jgi:hypothetical protein
MLTVQLIHFLWPKTLIPLSSRHCCSKDAPSFVISAFRSLISPAIDMTFSESLSLSSLGVSPPQPDHDSTPTASLSCCQTGLASASDRTCVSSAFARMTCQLALAPVFQLVMRVKTIFKRTLLQLGILHPRWMLSLCLLGRALHLAVLVVVCSFDSLCDNISHRCLMDSVPSDNFVTVEVREVVSSLLFLRRTQINSVHNILVTLESVFTVS